MGKGLSHTLPLLPAPCGGSGEEGVGKSLSRSPSVYYSVRLDLKPNSSFKVVRHNGWPHLATMA